MSKILYFDMTSGFSGDMGLASVISLGASVGKISDTLSELLKFKVTLSIEQLYRNSVLANRLIIETERDDKIFRGINEISLMINNSTLSDRVKERSLNTFNIIALAESEVHGIDLCEVHFHEIGAIDTIIDIVGFFYGLELLGIDNVLSSLPIFGYGTVETEHGVIPLPAPATLKILKDISCRRINVEGELTTPTGAAILREAVSEFADEYNGKIEKDIFVTGLYEFNGATNLLRTMVIDDSSYRDKINLIETNIDKMTGEEFGTLYDRLMSAGVVDISYTPIFMKKSRPAYKLSVMVNDDRKDNIIKTIFKHSESIGLRIFKVDRYIMDRAVVEVMVKGERVRIKRSSFGDIVKYQPEWADIVAVAYTLDISTREVEDIIARVLDNG